MNDTLATQSGDRFFFKKGLTDAQIDQLVHYAATDEGIRKFTSDPKRFASRESFDAWKKPGTEFYTLVDEKDNLMGIIWIEELPLPEVDKKNNQANNFDPINYHTTFAIRLYEKARGQGLSTPFTQKALALYGKKGIWLATSPDNLPAINSYKKSGFTELGMRQDGQKLIMILQ